MFILVLYLFTMLIRPQDWVPGFIGFPTASILIPLGILFGYAAHNKVKNQESLPQSKLIMLYLFLILISTMLGTDVGNGFSMFIEYLKRVLVFFMFYWSIQTKEQLKLVVTTLIALCVFVVYQAHLQAVEGVAWGGLIPYSDKVSQRSLWWGDWDGPNVVAIMFLVCVPFVLEKVWGPFTLVQRLIGLALVSWVFLGIIHTNSRGAMLTVVVVLLYNYRYRLLNPKILVLAVVIGSLLLAVAPSRVTKINSKEDSASERIWLWEEGMKFFRANLVFGLGKGEFQKKAELKLRAHSNYVQHFSEMGIVGYFVYIALLWATYKGNASVVSMGMRNHPSVLSINRALVNAIVAFATVTFFVTFELDFFYMILGLCAAGYKIALNENPDVPRPSWTRKDWIISAGATAGIYGAIWLAAVKEIL